MDTTALLVAWPVWASPWEFTASDWAGLTFFFVALAALIAARQAREARLLRIAQARPFVTLDLDPAAQTLLELRILNVGKTIARDVTFTFDPPLFTTHDDKSGRGPLGQLNVFKQGIPSLVPGKEIRLFFDQFVEQMPADYPTRYDVEISYTGPEGKRWHDQTTIDTEMYRGTGGITRNTIHDVNKQLKELVDILKRWTDHDGLKILTRTDRKDRAAEYRAQDEDQPDEAAKEE